VPERKGISRRGGGFFRSVLVAKKTQKIKKTRCPQGSTTKKVIYRWGGKAAWMWREEVGIKRKNKGLSRESVVTSTGDGKEGAPGEKPVWGDNKLSDTKWKKKESEK